MCCSDRLNSPRKAVVDLLSGISLGIEASLAAGEDADESWWPDVRVTPAAIRDLLTRERPKN